MNIYDTGDQVRIEVRFTDDDGQPADPTVVKLFYAGPGTETELTYDGVSTIVREGVGSYYVDIVPQMPGTWRYRWQGSGTVTAAGEERFEVRRSMFA